MTAVRRAAAGCIAAAFGGCPWPVCCCNIAQLCKHPIQSSQKKKKKKKAGGAGGDDDDASSSGASAAGVPASSNDESKAAKAEAEKKYNSAMESIKAGDDMWVNLRSCSLHDAKTKKVRLLRLLLVDAYHHSLACM